MPEQSAPLKDIDALAGNEDLDYQTILSSSILSCDDIIYAENISHINKKLIDIFRYAVYQSRIDDIDAMIKVNPELSMIFFGAFKQLALF